MALILRRREFLVGLVSAAFAAPAIVRAASIMPVKQMLVLGPGDRLPYLASPMDIMAVTRKAFVPRLYVQLWRENPLLWEAMQNA